MKKTIMAGVLALSLAALSGVAIADAKINSLPQTGVSFASVVSNLNKQGFIVIELERDHHGFSGKLMSKQGFVLDDVKLDQAGNRISASDKDFSSAISMSEALSLLQKKGFYPATKAEVDEDGLYEFRVVRSSDGKKFDLKVNPLTREILKG